MEKIYYIDNDNNVTHFKFIDGWSPIANEEKEDKETKVIARLADTMDKLLGFIASVHTLTPGQQTFVDDFRNDYAAWKALE